MSEMRVVGVRVELPANQPILLLRETEGDRYLPIWIGSVEATAIALEQQGVRPPRPLTHDLLKEIITALGRELEQVRITDLQEGTFYAELVFDGDVRVSARPSDSVGRRAPARFARLGHKPCASGLVAVHPRVALTGQAGRPTVEVTETPRYGPHAGPHRGGSATAFPSGAGGRVHRLVRGRTRGGRRGARSA